MTHFDIVSLDIILELLDNWCNKWHIVDMLCAYNSLYKLYKLYKKQIDFLITFVNIEKDDNCFKIYQLTMLTYTFPEP